MVSLDQIRTLEAKVGRAVAYIGELKAENTLLQKNLAKYRKRIDELEILINEYKEDQNAIEEGIKNALLHLDTLEDAIVKPPAAVAPPAAAPVPREIDEVEKAPVKTVIETDTDDPPSAGEVKDELEIF
ncbi:MAG: cell division protein ZapB [Spirochaetales bacterium]|jgi:FtsZ-binding cell division protein ZapB|nr:cell division protein ZapB [Spirochaetales bacterium]